MINCPPPEQLAALLDEQLPDSSKSHLEAHLNVCSGCQQTLLGFAVDTATLHRQNQLFHTNPEEPRAPAALLDELKRNGVASSPRPTDQPSPTAPTLPGYEILGELGRGGMAVVYRARQLGLNRLVALKVILGGRHAGLELRDRFRREAEAVARLQHPNIVQIHEIGEHDNLPYFSMELVEGGSLKEHLNGRPHSPRTAAEIVETLARAMHATHQAGVVHRDLKPANILLSAGGGLRTSVPKVSDFGLALHQDANEGWTRTGDILGTPKYMAPEQAQGRRGEIGPATDIHALGVILYELLTGHTPFAAQDDVSTLLQLSFEEALPPRRLQPSVPHDLETICLKCLRKLPRHRYTTALELAEDLRRFQAGEPILARPISTRERVVKWARRKPLTAALLVGMALLATGSFTGVTWAMLEARAARNEESIQRKKAEDAGAKTLEALDQSERSVYFGNIAQARSQWLLNNITAASRLLDRCRIERRGWEWHYLRSLNHIDLLTITDTGAPWVTSVAYSPDGRWIASSGGDPFTTPNVGIVQIHDSITGQLRWRRAAPSHLIHKTAFSPDGRFLASAAGNWREYGNGQLQMWNATTGELVFTQQVEHGIRALSFSPDGRRLATTGSEQPVRVWDTTNGKELYRATPARTDFVVFTPDGHHCLIDGNNGLEIHEIAGGKLVRSFPHVNRVVALSPDLAHLASVVHDQVSIWNISGMRANHGLDPEHIEITLAKSFDGHDGGLADLTFRPDGQAVATAGLDGTVRLRELRSESPPIVFRGHEGRVATVAFHPDGRLLASGSMQPGDIKVWDTTRNAEGVEAVTFAEDLRDIAALGFTKNDRELLVLSVGGILRRWDCAAGTISQRELPCTNAWMVPATPSAFSADGTILATISDPNMLRVVEAATGRTLATFGGHSVRVRFVACDRECRRVVSAADGLVDGRPRRELKVWDVATRQSVHEETQNDEIWDGVALSPDGTQLLEAQRVVHREADGRITSTPAGASLKLVSLTEGKEARPLGIPGTSVTAVAFSQRGGCFAAASNRLVQMWDRTGRPLHELPLPAPEGIAGLAFNPDETRLAGVNRERVQVWDVISGQDVLFLRGARTRHSDNSFNPRVAWSHDGTRLVVSNWNRTATVWDSADFSTPAGKALLRAQADSRVFSWHLGGAQGSRQSPFAAYFHRDRLLALKSLTPHQHRLRGDFLARSGRWDEAATDYAALFTAEFPNSPDLCESYGTVLAKRGDVAGYCSLRSRVLAHSLEDATTSNRFPSIRLLGLFPMTAPESAQVLTIANAYAKRHPQSPVPMDGLGLAYYRSGEWERARLSLLRAIEMRGDSDEAMFASVALALVHLRQAQPEKAEPILKRVDGWLATEVKYLTPTGVVPSQRDWVTLAAVELLRSEAESLRPKNR